MSYVPRDLSDIRVDDVHGSRIATNVTVYRQFGKRLLDLSLVVLSSPLVILVLLCCVVAIRLDGGPAFYRQERLGRGGRVFKLLKLRTMVEDAEVKLVQHLAENPAARHEWSVNQKLSRDPRITRVGRLLRRTSIDELPQMWNVLLGDMSMVGPRPMTVAQAPLYPGTAYYRLRPGITGPWQVSDRHESAFAARAGYDATYARVISFKTDLLVLKQTVAVVLRCTGI